MTIGIFPVALPDTVMLERIVDSPLAVEATAGCNNRVRVTGWIDS